MTKSIVCRFWKKGSTLPARFFPRSLNFLFTPLLAAASVAISSFFVTQALAAPIGTVIALTPGVTVERQGQRLPLALKDSLELHDTIMSDATGKAQIIFNDDSTVSIANNTSLSMSEFADTGSDPVFKAHIGQGLARIITGKVVEQNPNGFAVTTPEATVGIRGTVLTVASNDGRTDVYVENTLHKEVYVNDTLVPQGQMATVTSPDEKPQPRPTTPQEQQMLEEESHVADVTSASTNPESPNMPEAILGPEPDTALANVNLPQQQLGESVTGNLTATVSGSLNPSAPGQIGLDPAATDFVGSFSFKVNLSSGKISNASMTGQTALFATPNGAYYNLTGGSGTMQGANFNISGFSGTINYPLAAAALPAGTGSYMNGSGNVSTPGGSVSGNYYIDSIPVTGWNLDQGTFTGTSTGGK